MVLRTTAGGFLSTDGTVTTWGTDLTPRNASDLNLHQKYTEILVLESLTLIIALVGLAGNAVVLWLLGFRMRRNHFSVYILNLAGADFLFLCCQIIRSLYSLQFYWGIIYRVVSAVSIFAYLSGLSFLSAISTERCLCVLWPIWYRSRRPRHLSAVTCALLWALGLLLSILERNYCGILTGDVHYGWCSVLDIITFAWLILLFVLLSGSSLALLTRLLCGSQRVPLTRLFLTLLLTVLVFLLCGLPFGLNWFLLFWFPEETSGAFVTLFWVTGLLSCVNSCANPIIYFYVGSVRQRWWKGRQTLRLVLQRALQDTPELDECGGLPLETLQTSGSSVVS